MSKSQERRLKTQMKLSERIRNESDPLFADPLDELADEVEQLEAENERLRESIRDAMNNIGVPNAGYPHPMYEAYRILSDALKESE